MPLISAFLWYCLVSIFYSIFLFLWQQFYEQWNQIGLFVLSSPSQLEHAFGCPRAGYHRSLIGAAVRAASRETRAGEGRTRFARRLRVRRLESVLIGSSKIACQICVYDRQVTSRLDQIPYFQTATPPPPSKRKAWIEISLCFNSFDVQTVRTLTPS